MQDKRQPTISGPRPGEARHSGRAGPMTSSSSSRGSGAQSGRLSAVAIGEPPLESRAKRGGKRREQEEDEDAKALARYHDLLMAALRSAVVGSELLSSQDIFSLLLTSKETTPIVRQTVRAIAGGVKVLTLLPRYPSVRHLRLEFRHYSADPEELLAMASRMTSTIRLSSGFVVPPDLDRAALDLSRLQSLVVKMELGADADLLEGGRKPRQRGAGKRGPWEASRAHPIPITTVDDPLASLVIPALGTARLTELDLGNFMPGLPPGFTDILTTPSVSSLLSLTCRGAQSTNELAAIIWAAAEKDAFPHLQRLTLCGTPKASDDAHDSILALCRGVAARGHLKGIKNLGIYGDLGRQQHGDDRGQSAIRVLASESLNLSHLDNFCIDDQKALKEVKAMLDDADPTWYLPLFACKVLGSLLIEGGFHWSFVNKIADPATILKLEELVMSSPAPLVTEMALHVLLKMRQTLDKYHKGPYLAAEVASSAAIFRAITAFPNSETLIAYLVQWLGTDERFPKAVLSHLMQDEVYRVIIGHLIAACLPTVDMRPTTRHEIRQREEATMVFLLSCLGTVNTNDIPPYHPDQGVPAAITSEVVLEVIDSVINDTTRGLLARIVCQHSTSTARFNNQLCDALEVVMGSSYWPVAEMVEEVGPSLSLLIIDHRPSLLKAALPLVDMVADELSRSPKRFTANVLRVIGSLSYLPHEEADLWSLLADALFTSQWWTGFWKNVIADGSRFQSQLDRGMLQLLREAKKRGIGMAPSELVFPCGLKYVVEKLVDPCSQLVVEGEEWLIAVFWGSALDYIRCLVERMRRGPTEAKAALAKIIITKVFSSWEFARKGKVAATSGVDATKMNAGQAEGRGDDDLLVDLLCFQTDFFAKLCRTLGEEARKPVESVCYRNNLTLTIWEGMRSLAEGSKRFVEVLYARSFLSILLPASCHARSYPRSDVVEGIGSVMARHDPQRFVVEVVATASRATAQKTGWSMRELAAGYLGSLHREPWQAISLEVLVRVASLEVTPADYHHSHGDGEETKLPPPSSSPAPDVSSAYKEACAYITMRLNLKLPSSEPPKVEGEESSVGTSRRSRGRPLFYQPSW